MNLAWAIEKVSDFAALLEEDQDRHRAAHGRGTRETRTLLELGREVNLGLSTIIRIAERAEPSVLDDLQVKNTGGGWRYYTMNQATQVLLGAVQSMEDVERNLGPRGPQLAAASLHPWVWEASAGLWDVGYRREAIQAAATQLDIHMQAKVSRVDVSGKALVGQAFGLKPPEPGKPRLRLPGFEPGSETYTSIHEGVVAFATGCFQAIRNITTHRMEQPDEDAALEMLAALSVLARWTDAADVVTAEDDAA